MRLGERDTPVLIYIGGVAKQQDLRLDVARNAKSICATSVTILIDGDHPISSAPRRLSRSSGAGCAESSAKRS